MSSEMTEDQLAVICLQNKANESNLRYPKNAAKANIDFTLRIGFPNYCQYLGDINLMSLVTKIAIANVRKDNATAKAEIDKAKAFEKGEVI